MHLKVTAVNVFQPNKFRILAAIHKTRELHKLLHDGQLKEMLYDVLLTFLQMVTMIWCGSLGNLWSLYVLCLLSPEVSAYICLNFSIKTRMFLTNNYSGLWKNRDQQQTEETLNWTFCSSIPAAIQLQRAVLGILFTGTGSFMVQDFD